MSARDRVVFHPEAVAEARAAFAWYESRDESTARAFVTELDQAVTRVLEAPSAWPPWPTPSAARGSGAPGSKRSITR